MVKSHALAFILGGQKVTVEVGVDTSALLSLYVGRFCLDLALLGLYLNVSWSIRPHVQHHHSA